MTGRFPLFREIGTSLRRESYDVDVALSWEEALAMLALQSVDCILLDTATAGHWSR